MSNYSIAVATADDVEEIAVLFQNYASELIAMGLHYQLDENNLTHLLMGRIKSKLFEFYVAKNDNEIIGFVIGSIFRLSGEYLYDGEKMIGYLNDLFVKKEFRHFGVANELTQRIENWLRDNQIKSMELQVINGNDVATKYWLNQGVKPVRTVCYKRLL